jgi:hypothetical protein
MTLSYNYIPNLTGLTVIKTLPEQEKAFWYQGHPGFLIPDFNAESEEDIWIGFLNYLETVILNGNELYDQNGGDCQDITLLDPATGLTKCRYIATGIILREGDSEQDINVDVEGYVVSNSTYAYFVATRVDVHL